MTSPQKYSSIYNYMGLFGWDLVEDEAREFATRNNLISPEEAMNLPESKMKKRADYYWWVAMTLHLVDRKPFLGWWGEYYPAHTRD